MRCQLSRPATTTRLGPILLIGATCLGQMKLYVSPKGRVEGQGTIQDPFPTLERARDAIRTMKTGGGLPAGGVNVLLRGGTYERTTAFELEKQDSGLPEAPIVYGAFPGEKVRLLGGRVVTGFKQVTDETVLATLMPNARGKVYQADLRSRGITDLGGITKNRLALYFNDEPMPLSRYPNDGFIKIVDLLGGKPRVVRSTRGDAIGKFTCDSDRLGRWLGEKDPWVHGYWYWDWSDQRQKVKAIDPDTRMIELEEPYHKYGYRKGQWFYAFNLLSEIDSPGEWYLDRETATLYFYPPSPVENGTAIIPVAPSLVEMKDVAHASFEKIGFEGTRGTCIRINGGTGNRIVGCTIRNSGRNAVAVRNGEAHGVVGCDIYNMGGGGISLWGGDRKTLTPARHYAENNHIHHYGLWNRMYQKAISMGGVGHRAAHNLIHDAPHQAIGFWGNDHLIEFNEIHSVCFESNDAGAIYAGRDWTARGTVIRHNYMHDITGFRGRGCVGVYLDDMFSGTEISGNVFYRVTRAAFIGGGRDCLVENNLFIDCPRALHIDARALGWAHACADRWIEEAKTKGTLSGFRYKEPPYSTRWPELARILEGEPKAPEGNRIRRNVFYGKGWNDITAKARAYQTLEDNLTDADPRFVDYENNNFQLLPDSPAYALGFKRIPIEKIGLYQDEKRASWPVTHEVRPAAEPAPAKVARRAKRGPAPSFSVAFTRRSPTIDGILSDTEWPTRSMAIGEDVNGNPARPRSAAWLTHDGTYLYVGVRNDVDSGRPLVSDRGWGSNDAVEVAIRSPARGKLSPIFILRGYPDGKFESSTEAGAPEPEASALGVAVSYAARMVDPGRWTAEWRIPWSALGVDPAAHTELPFNLTVRKMASRLWLMWAGTQAHSWRVDQAGVILLQRKP